MMNLPKLTDLEISGKNVLVRADLEYKDRNSPRGKACDAMVDYLKQHNAGKIKLVGHKGIPEMLNWWEGVEVNHDIRADSREEENSVDMAKELANGWDIYVNEAFGVSHRAHTSVVALPLEFKSKFKPERAVAVGLRFEKEVENLSKVLINSKIPVVVIISGIKEDKLTYVESLSKIADKVLIAGRLPEYIYKIPNPKSQIPNKKLVVADLLPDKEDITIHSMEIFEEEINKAGTIVVSGPLGKYEEEGHRQGTERVFNAVVKNKNAFKVAGGGDTEAAISLLSLAEKFNWISVGGGAMLEFLSKGTLPGIEALVD